MRISFFIGQLVGGGAEKVLTMLANHYAEKGYTVEIVMLLGSGVEREHFHLLREVSVRDLSISGSYLRNIFPWLIRIRRYIKGYRPDAIISFIGRINALVLSAAFGLKIPTIISERSDPRHDGRSRVMLTYCNWVYHLADGIVFQTSYQRDCFSKTLRDRSLIIPNPIKVLPLPIEGINNRLVVTTGRLHEAKNQLMLIRAMALVRKSVPDAICEIYGDGEMKERLQAEINCLDLKNTVSLAGKKANITDYVSKCGVFVMSSDYEGLSNSIMEAMMLGKVCISTDYPGVEDLIENEVNGIIVPRGDVNEMARRIVEVIYDKDNRNETLRKNARNKMISYDESSVLSKWDSVLGDVIGTISS